MNVILQYIGNHLTNDAVSHPRRSKS